MFFLFCAPSAPCAPARDKIVDKPTAVIKATPEDFRVVEIPKVTPTGAGEHLLVRVRKRDANTPWVAQRLARWAGVPERAVSWAGLKDRRAITEQWFSLHLPGGADPDPAMLDTPGVEILEASRHSRKLRRGTLAGNAFDIVLRQVVDPPGMLPEVEALAAGVPNRFGTQRFGRGGVNLARASAWFSGGRPPRGRNDRAMAISAARSALFNAVLDARIESGTWARPVAGDIMMFEGGRGRFLLESLEEDALSRCAHGEIHPTGPLWGAGGSEASGDAAEVEAAATAPFTAIREGLEAHARPERRALRVIPRGLAVEAVEADALRVRFELPPGAYATEVLGAVFDLEGESDAGDD